MAEIRSATVGGAVAGGVLLPEPEGPWHFTWPDVVAKTIGDLANAYAKSKANPDAEPDDEDEEYPGLRTAPNTPPGNPGVNSNSATPIATGFGSPWFLLAAVVAAVFFLPRFLK